MVQPLLSAALQSSDVATGQPALAWAWVVRLGQQASPPSLVVTSSQQNEVWRTQTEARRTQNEAWRIQNEAQRTQNEAWRPQNETQRTLNEAWRTQNESQGTPLLFLCYSFELLGGRGLGGTRLPRVSRR